MIGQSFSLIPMIGRNFQQRLVVGRNFARRPGGELEIFSRPKASGNMKRIRRNMKCGEKKKNTIKYEGNMQDNY